MGNSFDFRDENKRIGALQKGLECLSAVVR